MSPLKIQDIVLAINMTNEDWTNSDSAPIMLTGLYLQDPEKFKSFVPVLHEYFLACCQKIAHLTPQAGLRDGVKGALKWIKGDISADAFHRLCRNAEADAFGVDMPKSEKDIEHITALANNIEQLKDLPFELAQIILCEAAYFVEGAMVYPRINEGPFVESLCLSRFLCPSLLRSYLAPNFVDIEHGGNLNIETNVSVGSLANSN